MQIPELHMTPVAAASWRGTLAQQEAPQPNPGVTFGQVLQETLQNVNQLQVSAQQANIKMAAGQVQDISEVMIAAEKASIAMQLTMQVRNKVLDAYQEIMRMQV